MIECMFASACSLYAQKLDFLQFKVLQVTELTQIIKIKHIVQICITNAWNIYSHDLTFSLLGNRDSLPLEASLAGELTDVAVSDAIRAAHWHPVPVAQDVAVLLALTCIVIRKAHEVTLLYILYTSKYITDVFILL